MPGPLKAYNPSEKGRELIALLFPVSHIEREKNIVKYWNQYPQEKKALLDGFHFIIQEIVETRQAGMNSDIVNLPEGFLKVIISQMAVDKNYFAYDSSDLFFKTVYEIEPHVFKDVELIEKLRQEQAKPKADKKSSSNLPDKLTADVEKKFKSVCKSAEKAYDELSRIQQSLINSQKFIDGYQKQKSDISLFEFKLAKETYLESKKVFIENSGVIAKGMQYVYEVYQQFHSHLMVKKSYIKYLAKLLGSREARNPLEKYILSKATGNFDFSVPDLEPTDQQLQHGITKYHLQKEHEQRLQKDVDRLEARYRKRKLTTLLKSDTPKTKIINELQEILKLDPTDIKTHIFLAKLLADYATSFNNVTKRGVFREQALKHCEAAFSKIDDYLDLQAIKQMKERDAVRSGFVKTISAIRIPLIKKK